MGIDAFKKPSAACTSTRHCFNSKTVKEYQFEDRAQQIKIEDGFLGITAKTVIKSLIPNLKHSLKENHKCFDDRKVSTASTEAN